MRIIMFDGVCNLCNRMVQFIIRHDPCARFHFVSLQSENGKLLLRQAGVLDIKCNSVVYLSGERYFLRSTAILHIFKDMRGSWQLLYAFIVIPRFIRDAVYDTVARMRYRICGKRSECMIPSEDTRERFL